MTDIAAPAMPIETTGSQERPWYKALWENFVFRRILRALLTVYLVSTMVFFLIRLLPGDPLQVYINQQITQYGYSYDEARNQAQALFAIDADQTLMVQYASYMVGLAKLDLGQSMTSPGTSVISIINSRIWWTIFSVGIALILSFVIGSVLGMLMALRRNSPGEGLLSIFASITQSIPNYLLAILIIVTFGVRLDWIPFTKMRGAISSGQEIEFSLAFFVDIFYHASLPISIYVLTTVGGWMLLMKSSTISVLEEDFVAAARARGVPEWRIAFFYVGRNAILPLFTQLTIAIGFVVGGSLLIEPIFVYEGIGSELWRSIQQRDYPMLQGIFLVVTVSVVAANLIADLLYSRLDPRIRTGGSE